MNISYVTPQTPSTSPNNEHFKNTDTLSNDTVDDINPALPTIRNKP